MLLQLERVYLKVSQVTKPSVSNSFIHSPTRIALLTYRVWAVWEEGKRMRLFLLMFYTVTWTTELVLVGFVDAEMKGM
jgi:hypothetical protein